MTFRQTGKQTEKDRQTKRKTDRKTGSQMEKVRQPYIKTTKTARHADSNSQTFRQTDKADIQIHV